MLRHIPFAYKLEQFLVDCWVVSEMGAVFLSISWKDQGFHPSSNWQASYGMAKLLDLLNERIVLGDGATGTYLYEQGVPLNHCLEELNLSQPDLLTRIYQEYAGAGAQVIETNSFGANRIRLARYGLDHQVSEINWRAASIAKEALKGRNVFVGGSVGPLSLRPADGENFFDCRPQGAFREQIGALIEGGCDLIFLETFTALDELLLALDVFQNLTNIPVVTSLGVSEEGRLVSGETFPQAVKILRGGGGRYRRDQRHLRPAGLPASSFEAGRGRGRPSFRVPQRGQA